MARVPGLSICFQLQSIFLAESDKAAPARVYAANRMEYRRENSLLEQSSGFVAYGDQRGIEAPGCSVELIGRWTKNCCESPAKGIRLPPVRLWRQ